MSSVKQEIFSILQSSYSGEIAYGFSDSVVFPKVIFFLVASHHKRLSNKKIQKHFIYQVNVYDHKAHDVTESSVLSRIEAGFEESVFNSGEWEEIIHVGEDGKTEFMYSLEVYT